ncbi:unnamed protein product [Camellia sinensis]
MQLSDLRKKLLLPNLQRNLFWLLEGFHGAIMHRSSSGRFSSYERLVVIGLGLLAVVSPLYIDRRTVTEPELDEQPINISSYLPLLLWLLIMVITLLCYLEQSFIRFDPCWIYRVGGSSVGIVVILMLLALILKCKASTTTSTNNWGGD